MLFETAHSQLESSGDAAVHTELNMVGAESAAKESGTEAPKERKRLHLTQQLR